MLFILAEVVAVMMLFSTKCNVALPCVIFRLYELCINILNGVNLTNLTPKNNTRNLTPTQCKYITPGFLQHDSWTPVP